MKLAIRILLATLFVLILASPPSGHAQTTTQKTTSKAATSSEADYTKEKRAVLHRPPAHGHPPAEG